MKNLMIYIQCVVIDFEDVQVQINTLVNNILFALSLSDFSPTSSVNYHKDGLVITINDVSNLMDSSEVIINILEDHGWLDSVIKIELNDLLSGRSAYLIPRFSSANDRGLLSDIIVPISSNQPLSNRVNFN